MTISVGWNGTPRASLGRGDPRLRTVVLVLALVCAASASHAQLVERADLVRPGWYVGVGAGSGIPFLEDAIEDEVLEVVELRPGGSFNARIGYRALSWVAFELQYEGAYGSNIKILGQETAAERTTHSIAPNLKLILPIRRLQPYFMLGTGAQYARFDGHGPFDGLGVDLARWDFMVRVAGGLDLYLTRHWLVNLELGGAMSFKDWSDVPSKTTDVVMLNVSVGLGYRF